MAAPDYSFYEGFDKYGNANGISLTAALLAGEWTSLSLSGSSTATLQNALAGTGKCFQLSAGTTGGATSSLSKTLPANYARVIGGFWCTVAASDSTHYPYLMLLDGSTAQVTMGWTTGGQFVVHSGSQGGTVLGTDATSYTIGSVHCIEYDITFHATAGIVKIWIDGALTTINLTSVNTAPSGNARFSQIRFGCLILNATTTVGQFDHLYFWCYTASGGTETPALTNPIVETQVAIADSSTAWSVGAAILGTGTQLDTTTIAGTANSLYLRKFTAGCNATVDSVSMLPGATSAPAKFKAVMYADSGSGTAPGTLMSDGAEIVGTTSGTLLTSALTTPQSITAGTIYWIGFIADTAVAMRRTDSSSLGYRAANTYTGGAPGTAPAMTSGQGSYLFYGNLSSVSGGNYSTVNDIPPDDNTTYVASSNIGDEDLYTYATLVSTPLNIYGVAVKARAQKTDAGSRTMDLRTKSSATDSAGDNAGQALSGSWAYYSSYFLNDPATGSPWGAPGLNNAKSGVKVAS